MQKKPLVSMSANESKPGGFGATTGSDSLALLVANAFSPITVAWLALANETVGPLAGLHFPPNLLQR